MIKMDETTAIKQFLNSHKVHISSEWLADCINWCKEEALPHNHSIKDLKEKVFEQWLLLDLRDVEVPCLPPNLSSKQKFSLSGTFFLQIMEIIDISKPKYWQIQKIRNETPKNLDNENINSKRMLMLILTDGVQEIKAMELKPIPFLNLNITPGVKIKLIGPIMIRRGRLLLEDHNIKVIGGEVDTILISNAAENVLARHLNLPLNPNPNKIQESMIAPTNQLDNTDSRSTQNSSVYQLANNQSVNNYIANNQILKNNSNARNIKNIQNYGNQRYTEIIDEFNDMDNIFEDEDKINEEIEMIMELERTVDNSVTKNTKQKTPDIFDDMEIDDFHFETNEFSNTIKKSSIANKNLVHKNHEPDDDLTKSLEDGIDVFENLDVNIDTNINNIDKEKRKKTLDLHTRRDSTEDFVTESKKTDKVLKIQSPPQVKINVWSIERLNKNLPNINNGKFKIKARFKSIIEKLSLTDETFHLVVAVEDESGSIIVKVHDEVVSTLAGCTAATLIGLKSQVKENVVSAQAKVLEVLKKLKDNLIKFDSFTEIVVKDKEKLPVLIKIL